MLDAADRRDSLVDDHARLRGVRLGVLDDIGGVARNVERVVYRAGDLPLRRSGFLQHRRLVLGAAREPGRILRNIIRSRRYIAAADREARDHCTELLHGAVEIAPQRFVGFRESLCQHAIEIAGGKRLQRACKLGDDVALLLLRITAPLRLLVVEPRIASCCAVVSCSVSMTPSTAPEPSRTIAASINR